MSDCCLVSVDCRFDDCRVAVKLQTRTTCFVRPFHPCRSCPCRRRCNPVTLVVDLPVHQTLVPTFWNPWVKKPGSFLVQVRLKLNDRHDQNLFVAGTRCGRRRRPFLSNFRRRWTCVVVPPGFGLCVTGSNVWVKSLNFRGLKFEMASGERLPPSSRIQQNHDLGFTMLLFNIISLAIN